MGGGGIIQYLPRLKKIADPGLVKSKLTCCLRYGGKGRDRAGWQIAEDLKIFLTFKSTYYLILIIFEWPIFQR